MIEGLLSRQAMSLLGGYEVGGWRVHEGLYVR